MFTFGEIAFTLGEIRFSRGFSKILGYLNFFVSGGGGVGTLWVGGPCRGFRRKR